MCTPPLEGTFQSPRCSPTLSQSPTLPAPLPPPALTPGTIPHDQGPRRWAGCSRRGFPQRFSPADVGSHGPMGSRLPALGAEPCQAGCEALPDGGLQKCEAKILKLCGKGSPLCIRSFGSLLSKLSATASFFPWDFHFASHFLSQGTGGQAGAGGCLLCSGSSLAHSNYCVHGAAITRFGGDG